MILIEERETKKLPGLHSLFVSFEYNQELVAIFKKLEVFNYDKKTKEWEIPLTSLSEIINKTNSYDTIKLKTLKKKEITSKNYPLQSYKIKPFNYQLEGIEYGLNHNKWLLLDAPGLGKTLQTIYLSQELKEKGVSHCLVICGINTLKYNWVKEIKFCSDLDCMILGEKTLRSGKKVIGSVQERIEQLKSPIKEFFIITNIETLRNPEIIKQLTKGINKIDLTLMDEIHTCKNPTSIQGSNLLKLKDSKYKVGMTGTLLLNNPLDCYLSLKWLGIEKSNFSTFKRYYCSYGGVFNKQIVGYKHLEVLKEQLSNVSLRRLKNLDVPKTIIPELLEMEDSHMKFYQDIENGVLEQVDKVTMKTGDILGMTVRLRQATANPAMLSSGDISATKLDRAQQLAEEVIENGNKIVIFSTFKESVYELEKRLKKYNPAIITGDFKDAQVFEAQEKLQNDEDCKLLIGTWQKAGTGITLTKANYMIFIDTPWTDGAFTQACDRIYRIGTKGEVTIYNLICKDTIDEKVWEILQSKKALSEFVVDDKLDENTTKILSKYLEELKNSKNL